MTMRRLIITTVCLLLQCSVGNAATALEIQSMLRDLGYQPGVVDGRWGTKSREALKHFQADQALKVTGKSDPETINALYATIKAKNPQPADTSANSSSPKVTPPVQSNQASEPAKTIDQSNLAPAASNQTPPTGNTSAAQTATDTPINLSVSAEPKPESTLTKKSSHMSSNANKPSVESPAGIGFMRIPGGCFNMGGGSEYSHEACVHQGSSFLIGQYEITQEQWKSITGQNPSTYKNGINYPVESVSWNDVKNFTALLNAKKQGHYRLPTEAEWEYSARAGTKTKYWWGDTMPVCDAGKPNGANFNGGSNCPNATVPVGTYKSNQFGLYDVLGNVWEWVEDLYLPDAYQHSPKQDPVFTKGGTDRVFRGGSWLYPADAMTAFHRDHAPPEFQFSHLGFRLIYEP